MKDGCSTLSLARLIGSGQESLHSRPPAPQQCALCFWLTQAAIGERIEAGYHLCEHGRRAQRRKPDAGPQTNASGHSCNGCQGHQRFIIRIDQAIKNAQAGEGTGLGTSGPLTDNLASHTRDGREASPRPSFLVPPRWLAALPRWPNGCARSTARPVAGQGMNRSAEEGCVACRPWAGHATA